MDAPTNSEVWEIRECERLKNNPLAAEGSVTMHLEHLWDGRSKEVVSLGFLIETNCVRIPTGVPASTLSELP